MSDNSIRMSLDRGERIEKVIPHENELNLVSDNNSRWIYDDETDSWYFVVNGKYKAPQE